MGWSSLIDLRRPRNTTKLLKYVNITSGMVADRWNRLYSEFKRVDKNKPTSGFAAIAKSCRRPTFSPNHFSAFLSFPYTYSSVKFGKLRQSSPVSGFRVLYTNITHFQYLGIRPAYWSKILSFASLVQSRTEIT